MESVLFATRPAEAREGWPVPGALVRESGLWVEAAGFAALGPGVYPLRPCDGWRALVVEEGEVAVLWRGEPLRLAADGVCLLPAGDPQASLDVPERARCLWYSLAGRLAPDAARVLGALPRRPAAHQAMLGQTLLARRLANAAVRASGGDGADFQLAQLLYGLLSATRGRPVAVDAPLSREIARVVEALRADRYEGRLSLAEMAKLAGLPEETFRKRFVSEVGMPPLRYVTHFKMQRARELLLLPGSTVAQVAAQVGVSDPYRFSKLFKSVVGLSPSEFIRQASSEG